MIANVHTTQRRDKWMVKVEGTDISLDLAFTFYV